MKEYTRHLCKSFIKQNDGSFREYIQINTWTFPYWLGYHPETPILAQDGVEGQYGSRDDNQFLNYLLHTSDI
jgi:hypothetical protein